MYFLQPISCLKYFGYVSEKWRISLFLESLKKEELASQNSYFIMEWVRLAGWNSVANGHFRLGFSLPNPSPTPSHLISVSLISGTCLALVCKPGLMPLSLEIGGVRLRVRLHWGHAWIWLLDGPLGWCPWLYPIVCYQGNTGIQHALSIGEVL